MARVRGVTAGSISAASMFRVSFRESTNTGLAPNIAKALAVETNVYEGTMTSSPGERLQSNADISRA
jgi:hypothetical protein